MPDQNDDKREMRMMWIFSAAVVLLILGAMGINMLVHHETNAATPETHSVTYRTAEVAG
jgi:hypothetical protein